MRFAVVAEALTGLALVAAPELVLRLLIGGSSDPAGQAAARVAGVALLALSLACWPRPSSESAPGPAHLGMLFYGASVAVYFLVLGLGGALVGPLLWPAFGLHVAITVALLREYRRPG